MRTTARRRAISSAVAAALAALGGLAGAPAAPAAPAYSRCGDVPGTTLVMAARVGCDEARTVAEVVGRGAADDAPAMLRAIGWTPLRAESLHRGSSTFDLIALRDRAVVRIRRRGGAPDLDGWAAGRELIFAAGRIVGGAPIPAGAATCTSSFLVRLDSGRLGGLSAAHCGGLGRSGRVVRRNAALRRPPAFGIVLGGVQRILTRHDPLDALLLPVPSGPRRSHAGIVNRGISRPPWIVAGTADLTPGRAICFTGRTSGIDRCGRLRGRGVRPLERLLSLRSGVVVRCTTASAAPGDSGGPVFTAPREDGTVRALGIVTLVVGPARAMCFTPIRPVLRRLHAQVVTARTTLR